MTAEELYKVYGGVTDFKNFQGNPMPEWDALPNKIKLAWETCAAAKDAETNLPRRIPLDERERAQIAHAQEYTVRHSNAGVPGHGQFILIAKLANVLGL